MNGTGIVYRRFESTKKTSKAWAQGRINSRSSVGVLPKVTSGFKNGIPARLTADSGQR